MIARIAPFLTYPNLQMTPVNSPVRRVEDTPMTMFYLGTMTSYLGTTEGELQDSPTKTRITKTRLTIITKRKLKGRVNILDLSTRMQLIKQDVTQTHQQLH